LLTEALEDFVHLETGKPVRGQRLAWNLLGSRLLREPEETVFALSVRFPLKAAVFGFDALKKLPRRNGATERLVEFLGAPDLYRISP
jgi:hypothetical protein